MINLPRTVVIISVVTLLGACATLIPIKLGPIEEVTIESTPDQMKRGEYLANNVMFCIHCHSQQNLDYFATPVIKGTEGMGGTEYVESVGTIYASNITPAALGSWTDGELIRAIAEGVNKNGEPLFPIMPSQRYRNMDKEDLFAVVAYIKSLKPIKNSVPQKKLKFPFKHIERTFPQPYEPFQATDPADQVAHGRYLATIADCISCHTPMTKTGKPVPGMELAGGYEFPLHSGGTVRAVNITPDPATGIGDWDEDYFIERFKEYGNGEYIKVDGKDNTVMPWISFAGMTEADLKAIYAFLQSVKPIVN